MKNVETKKVEAVITAKTKENKTVKISTYKSQVNNVNRHMKEEFGTLGGAIKYILMFGKEAGLEASRIKIFRAIKNDRKMYDSFKEKCRSTKKGKYPVYYVLQHLNKTLSNELLEIEKANKAEIKAKLKATKLSNAKNKPVKKVVKK